MATPLTEPTLVDSASLPQTQPVATVIAGDNRVVSDAERFAQADRESLAQLDQQNAQASARSVFADADRQSVEAFDRWVSDNNSKDWRAKLSLAPSADYLYKVPYPESAGVLAPLAATNGVIFPYTPSISVMHQTSYQEQLLTHSNFKGYFYTGSSVGEIHIEAKFTAQDTYEAAYLLAVLHFFRSAGKMFYGQDDQRGTPPPLLFLSAFGKYQYNNAPCLLRDFNYQLPSEVDYIRTTPGLVMNSGAIEPRRRIQASSNPLISAAQRLFGSGLAFGGRRASTPSESDKPLEGSSRPSSDDTEPTYVPTMVDVTLTLLPVHNRDQMSKEFSLKEYASGSLLTRGFY